MEMEISIEDLARKVRDVWVKEYGEDVVAKFLPKKESEDERIRQELITFVKGSIQDEESEQRKTYLAWLEKQGEHKRFRDSILVGDNVTKNEDGYIVNLSQLRRVAKRDADMLEKQGGTDNSPLEGSTNFVMTDSNKKTDKQNPEEFIEANTEWSNALQEGFINVDMARKAVEMERERIKAEIERRREAVDDHNLYLENSDQGLGYSLALDDMLNFICKSKRC